MTSIDITAPTPLLAGLSPQQFMKRHWHKKPLLVRQALPMAQSFVSRNELFALAAEEGVESRLIEYRDESSGSLRKRLSQPQPWRLKHGPLPRRALPPLTQPRWSLLVQGLDLHLPAAREVLERFRFVPDARLDDVMVSYASDQGGVGPHFDSYDVFLLQIHGKRRWRIGRLPEPELLEGAPLKILTNFEAEEEWLLEPGDMLYLPPRWAHDGIAEDGECMTCSIGFRAPSRDELAQELLQRSLDAAMDAEHEEGDEDPLKQALFRDLYRDPQQAASATPARIPDALRDFSTAAVQRWLAQHLALDCALGEVLSEPKPNVCFDGGTALHAAMGVQLDQRSRMLYDEAHIFINGEAFRAGGRDARLMQQLADSRQLAAAEVGRLSDEAFALLSQWAEAGWLHAQEAVEDRSKTPSPKNQRKPQVP